MRGPAAGGYYASPPGESVDGSRYPWGWEELDFAGRELARGGGRRGLGCRADAAARQRASRAKAGGWQLVPRSLPPMEETDVRFAAVRRAEGIGPGDGFLRGKGDLVVPARTSARALLDQAHLTNAYAVARDERRRGQHASPSRTPRR